MFLEKLEIQGFKSFANKNFLIFPGLVSGNKRGLTAIVGPNGSGKSNVADAVRWALGEQSLKTLRGKKSEDVIFSGSDKKQRLGSAEVSLFLNNSEVNKKSAAAGNKKDADKEGELEQIINNYSEIVITRRLYRSGESEYLLNGNRVRLSDIQMLLAKANFGQKTYSVIGQGMVENFLTSSAAERKDFFDEATGVKQFQIKREAAINKLESSYANLQQVDMLLSEIRPRLKSLTRSVEKLKRRGELEEALRIKQLRYYSSLWQEDNSRLAEINSRILGKEKSQREHEAILAKLNEELNKIRLKDNRPQLAALQAQIRTLNEQREGLLKQLARYQAESAVQLESQGKFDLSWLSNKKSELEESLQKAKLEIDNLDKDRQDEERLRRENELNGLQKQISTLNSELSAIKEASRHRGTAEDQEKKLKRLIQEFLSRLEDLAQQDNLEAVKAGLLEIKNDWLAKTKELSGEDWQRVKEIQEEILSLTEKKQQASERLNEEKMRLAAINERHRLIREQIIGLEQEIAVISNKIAKNSGAVDNSALQADILATQQKLDDLEKRIRSHEQEREELSRFQEQEKALMYRSQQSIQAEQSVLDSILRDLGRLQVEAAREETRLEDLEANIRLDKLQISDIKNYPVPTKETDLSQLQRDIASAKNQLEQIGGIDPETETEYLDTKNRYDFLSAQTSDLNQTIDSMELVISELDKNIKARFESEFKIISDKFNEYFKILFNGGSAKIGKVFADELENNNAASANGDQKSNGGPLSTDNAEQKESDARMKRIRALRKSNAVGLAGIDIQATPPGKKIQAVTMLSGGERALTAIALICAIISANPSPFVVLDEVDAALDEANSQRLARILDDLSNQTQFIVITHNRACMRQASVLYGVTMEADGVSKLLSVKLDDLKK